MSAPPPGQLILLNGPSSAGKSTLCREIQALSGVPLLHFSLDFFLFGHSVLPRLEQTGPFSWRELRPRLFEGYFGCLAALLSAGNSLVADFIIETTEQWQSLRRNLQSFDVFLVGVHCPLPELERRERARGDRREGDARRDSKTVHTFTPYDFEVDSARPAGENAAQVLEAWQARRGPGVVAEQ